jgi:hypothetical protein
MTFSEFKSNNQIAETYPWGDSHDTNKPKIPSSHFELVDGNPTEVVQIKLEKSLPLKTEPNFIREEWNNHIIYVFSKDGDTGKQVTVTIDTTQVSELSFLQKIKYINISDEKTFQHAIRLLPYSEKSGIKYQIIDTKKPKGLVAKLFSGISKLKKTL